jgi:hypothetical protein
MSSAANRWFDQPAGSGWVSDAGVPCGDAAGSARAGRSDTTGVADGKDDAVPEVPSADARATSSGVVTPHPARSRATTPALTTPTHARCDVLVAQAPQRAEQLAGTTTLAGVPSLTGPSNPSLLSRSAPSRSGRHFDSGPPTQQQASTFVPQTRFPPTNHPARTRVLYRSMPNWSRGQSGPLLSLRWLEPSRGHGGGQTHFETSGHRKVIQTPVYLAVRATSSSRLATGTHQLCRKNSSRLVMLAVTKLGYLRSAAIIRGRCLLGDRPRRNTRRFLRASTRNHGVTCHVSS